MNKNMCIPVLVSAIVVDGNVRYLPQSSAMDAVYHSTHCPGAADTAESSSRVAAPSVGRQTDLMLDMKEAQNLESTQYQVGTTISVRTIDCIWVCTMCIEKIPSLIMQ